MFNPTTIFGRRMISSFVDIVFGHIVTTSSHSFLIVWKGFNLHHSAKNSGLFPLPPVSYSTMCFSASSIVLKNDPPLGCSFSNSCTKYLPPVGDPNIFSPSCSISSVALLIIVVSTPHSNNLCVDSSHYTQTSCFCAGTNVAIPS